MSTLRASLIVIRAALLLLVAGEAGSCGWFSFNTTVDIAPQVIPGNVDAAAAPATTMTVSTIQLGQKNLPSNADLANSVKLSSVTLKVVTPGSGTFGGRGSGPPSPCSGSPFGLDLRDLVEALDFFDLAARGTDVFR